MYVNCRCNEIVGILKKVLFPIKCSHVDELKFLRLLFKIHLCEFFDFVDLLHAYLQNV